jgi:glycerol-3-phosphate dehydrogenase
MQKTQVVIIGGGVTGAGLLWDLSLRGIPAVLLEKKDLTNGATGVMGCYTAAAAM